MVSELWEPLLWILPASFPSSTSMVISWNTIMPP
jgi:hypothetical protein